MVEKRLDRMESMISQLIQMVGNMNEKMDSKFLDMDKKFQEMDETLHQMDNKNEVRHGELVEQIKHLEIDQDFLWEKSARNEREIANIKRRLG